MENNQEIELQRAALWAPRSPVRMERLKVICTKENKCEEEKGTKGINRRVNLEEKLAQNRLPTRIPGITDD
jgi:hypothetical protein